MESTDSLPLPPTLNPFVTTWVNIPPDETDDQMQQRFKAIQDAQAISKQIDENLQETKRDMEKRKKAMKILLLGQSESGKSSVLKNFQLAFAPKQFQADRAIWKTIIQLNIISSLKFLLDILKEELDQKEHSDSERFRKLRLASLGLSPLFFIETNIMRKLSPESKGYRDLCIRAGSGWKSILRASRSGSLSCNDRLEQRRSHALTTENDPTAVLSAQKEEIISLWENSTTREILKKRRTRMEDWPGFFLNDISRIATLDYEPTDSDIIRARIRTVGIEEHHFVVEKGADANSDVYITDVGGCRSQRASWVPYFDDVQAILFLAPLAFNQTLEENPRVNRLEDSLSLWKELCSSKLLATANLILFFNKKDVLAATLASGTRVQRYVPSYGDLPNNVESVTKYFRQIFRACLRKHSPMQRPFMCYETSAIDIKSMSLILLGVRESILRQNLRDGEIL